MTVQLELGEYAPVSIGDRVQYKDTNTINGVLEDIEYNEAILCYFVRKSNNQLEYCPVYSCRRMRKKNRKKYPKSQKAQRKAHLDDWYITVQ
jgi:hypothetical protein